MDTMVQPLAYQAPIAARSMTGTASAFPADLPAPVLAPAPTPHQSLATHQPQQRAILPPDQLQLVLQAFAQLSAQT
jgi:hypothetical protein